MERARIEGRAFFFLQQECELLVESIDYAAKALNSSAYLVEWRPLWREFS